MTDSQCFVGVLARWHFSWIYRNTADAGNV